MVAPHVLLDDSDEGWNVGVPVDPLEVTSLPDA
jgi:hypothetical protein